LTAESKEKKTNGLQIFLVVLVLVSMVLNVYLFRYYAKQDDDVEVIASWEAANQQIQKDLSSVTAMLTDVETRQSTQETTTKEVLNLLESQPWVEGLSTITDSLTAIEARQVEEALAPVPEPNWVDKETWNAADLQIQETLSSVRVMLTDLETRQSALDAATTDILETLVAMDARQAEEALAPAPEPNWVDKESWKAANEQIRSDLSSVTTTLVGLETRITDSLATVEARQAAEDAKPAVEPNWVDKESWEAANEQIRSDLSSVTTTLVGLETRITDSLVMVEARQAAEDAEPVAEPNWVDKDSWETANAQTQEELSVIKEMLIEITAKSQEAAESAEAEESTESPESVESALNPGPASEPDSSIQVMASAPEATYVQHAAGPSYLQAAVERDCSIVEVRLLRGDSVWSIVSRFKSPPSPALVKEVVEYNCITDPRRLPVGFPVRIPMELVNGSSF